MPTRSAGPACPEPRRRPAAAACVAIIAVATLVLAAAITPAATMPAAAIPLAADPPAAIPPLASHPEGPPPAHTGGFGEPTCHACHFGADLDAPGGLLALDGIPDAYEPGRTYALSATLVRPGMGRAGFQLAARIASGPGAGRQAGVFRALDANVDVVADGAPAVLYAQHAADGTRLERADTARWTIEWTAPAEAAGDVVFHAAANAADNDESPFGDVIHTTSRISAGPRVDR